MSEVMLFPLGSVIFPEGKMRLRIFEPRYKRLVTQASQGDNTFGICLFERQSQDTSVLSAIGTQVRIVDFETLDDGLLGITVVGMKRFLIRRVRQEHDGLRIAKVEWLPEWPQVSISSEFQHLADNLQRLYSEFPEIGSLYDQRFFDDGCWVSQRWLELLPLRKKQFDFLTQQSDCQTALSFLDQAIECEKKL
ncbi:hypothetical protein SAMN04488136_12486 [Vibrio xiamenensis]|uniref:Lon N-terminal domain-containing protein n=1 Tax=Vibrio xiamenensis TaxID=861298 RepID=A0A1G8EH10_9VIBR|nr:LON peptidase substrate-binding domain-containing protein [Vibrio xiamenensis]SDH68989.1 hypothetical protein SAMN04488136_12486 [Vibrio xiamenensis]